MKALEDNIGRTLKAGHGYVNELALAEIMSHVNSAIEDVISHAVSAALLDSASTVEPTSMEDIKEKLDQ